MATDFSVLLSRTVDSVKRPPTKPPGTYHASILNYKFDHSANKKTPLCRFTFSNVQPGEDVDPALLKDDEGEPIDLSKWQPTVDFYLTENAFFRLREFIESLDVTSKGRGFQEVLPETRGMPVLLTVTMNASDDGTSFFNRVQDVRGAK